MTTEPVKQHVIAILERMRDRDKLVEQRIAEYVAQGRTIVYTSRSGRGQYEVSGNDTGEVLASVEGGREAFDALVASPEAANWVWLESITDDVRFGPTGGLPRSLCDALDDWVCTLAVSDEDVADFIGWNPEDVAGIRND